MIIELRLNTRMLGSTIFGFSPLGEVSSSLRALSVPERAGVHRPWLLDIRSRLDHVDLGLLTAVAGEGKWVPDFLHPTVSRPTVAIEEQLEVLSRLTGDETFAELRHYLPDGSVPARLAVLLDRGADAGQVLADAVNAYWSAAVSPYWAHLTNVLEDDVAFRASTSLSRGLFCLFDDLHARVSVGTDALLLDMPGHDARTYGEAALTLAPSVFVWPGLIVTHEVPGRFQLTYGARGAARLWEHLSIDPREAHRLAALVGRTRAEILQRLSSPHSTTQLARELGHSPASISQHLQVLRESGLATSQRVGRVVLY